MAKDRRATDPKQLRHASVLMLPNSQSAFATQPQSGFKESSRNDNLISQPRQPQPKTDSDTAKMTCPSKKNVWIQM
jgi:hypothetical protein